MAPSSDHRQDVNPNENTPEKKDKENPFIKFRQLADSHIGTLLQGIIGLPSALSKNTSGNARWADFDDDLRRRDELQAKQRQLKEEDARRHEDEHSETSTTKSGWELVTPEPKGGMMSNYFPHNVKEGRDIPLYSPVTKALFRQLDHGDSAENWGQLHPMATLGDIFRIEYFPFQVMQNQKPSNDMEAVQFMAYNELNRSNNLHSDYSLLPYLLFSPYSPIRLKLEASKERKATAKSTEPFPYDIAFEDLIRTTMEDRDNDDTRAQYGSRRSSENLSIQDYPRENTLLEQKHVRSSLFRPFNLNRFQANPSAGWMAWIHNLYGKDLLQEQEYREIPAQTYPSYAESNKKPSVVLRLPDESEKDTSDEEDSELDMYQRFLHWASTPFGIAGALDALCNDPEGFLEKQLKVLESPEGKRVVEELLESKFAKEVKDLVDMLEGFERPDNESQNSPTTMPKAPQDPGKVVSTSTTTEHTTHEDGSVETYVTVWKRYADGRESVTTTNHVDNLPCDENGNKVASQTTEVIHSSPEEKKAEKKGWFWN